MPLGVCLPPENTPISTSGFISTLDLPKLIFNFFLSRPFISGLFLLSLSKRAFARPVLNGISPVSGFGSTLGAGGSQGGSISNGIRGLYAGMSSGSGIRDTIEGITIASTGTFEDYGDLHAVREQCTGSQSTTRGIICGGITPSNTNVIEYVTIMTEGDAVDFGDLTRSGNVLGAGTGSSTRMLIGGGANPSITNVIDYITISTLGNSTDFGDLTQTNYHMGVFSSSTRGVWLGGRNPDLTNTIEYVEIMTTGNAKDFGDMYDQIALFATTSNGHGGL